MQVVVGARSAVFAPGAQPGADRARRGARVNSFKQETAPRYHARDVAIRRAAAGEHAPGARLGDAVAGKLARAQQGEYRLVEMPRRVLDRPMPHVGTIDLRNEIRSKASPRGDPPPTSPGHAATRSAAAAR